MNRPPVSPGAAPAPHEVTLVLVLHDHQPVGNFDDVFRTAFRDAYAPFLEFLGAHPALRLALHTSGPLIEWLEAREPRYLDHLRARVLDGQIEPWGGGFYEPILAAIPERDRRGQIAAMAEWIERRLGVRPRGMWLAERVWEPGLASSLVAAGVEYTAVDDALFVAAGFERDALWGSFLTEDQGYPLRVFPIHRELRYRIPFGEPGDVVALLRRVGALGPGRVAVLGDDGEKFGLWPGTRRLCYEEGWLERFLEALAAEPWIRLRTPAEAISGHPPLGLAYLPAGSYHEMQEWSLPPAGQARYQAAARILAAASTAADSDPAASRAAEVSTQVAAGADESPDLLRGGHWRNFLTRYPESNRLHKRMLRASQRLGCEPLAADPAWERARAHLWRAQCNCPYWHGVFGGLYLPHLRAAAYRELIAAETWEVRGTRTERRDFDLDGWDDALLETPEWAAWISARGGRMWAFDDRLARWNWGDTLAQRREHYHERLAGALLEAAGNKPGTESIHGAIKLKESGLAERLAGYRTHDRDSFLDRWSEGDAAAFPDSAARTETAGDVATDTSGLRAGIEVEPRALITRLPEGAAPGIEKRFAVAADGALEMSYALSSRRARLGTLSVEMNVAIHVAEAEDRWIEVEGARATPAAPGARARHERVTRSGFVDGWAGRRLEIATDRPATLERAPIETVSLSEAGAERVFQGVEATYSFPVRVEPGVPWKLVFRMRGRAEETA